nr:type VI secretion system Vgr family protein [Caballeronia sp. GAWG2-1]
MRTSSNNKLRLEDERGKEGIKLSTEYGGKTQLNMGYLVDSERKKRGEGFELRSDDWGSLRGGKGLFLSADKQPRAGAQALDMSAALAQLQSAQARMQSLSEAVKKAQAVVADCEAQKTLLETQLKDLQQAVLLASAPHGVALTSGEHMQFSAAGHLFTTTGGNADAAIGGITRSRRAMRCRSSRTRRASKSPPRKARWTYRRKAMHSISPHSRA